MGDKLLVLDHLNEALGDHREVLNFYILPVHNLQLL